MGFVVRSGDEGIHSELPALEQLVKMGYEYKTSSQINHEREKTTQVLLYDRLRNAIQRINPELDSDNVNDALNQIHENLFHFNKPVSDTNEIIHAKIVGLSKSGGLEPITVKLHSENGIKIKTVKLIDFDNIDNNDFIVTNQFQLQGFKHPIFPDIVLFINGIPLVIIECKSPFLSDWLMEAVEKNFKKYRSDNKGYDRLMFYNHILIATCGNQARHGTISSDYNSFQNSRWSSAYQLTNQQILEKFGKKREQEILIAGMLNKTHLLQLLKNFVIYKTINNTKIKIIAKHQQYRATTLCMEKIKTVKDHHGGIIWHTQGSGKSFTMHWIAKLAKEYNNPPLLIITDRLQLDKQIHETFKNSGFSDPIRANTAKDLAHFIDAPKGKTLMSTIKKFEEISNTTNEQVIVLVDEAHRSQFGIDAGIMNNAIPHGIYFGFTGTPIDKKDRSVYRVFGSLIDKYGFKESKNDGATIPIKYTGRLPKLFIEGNETIDALFDRIIGAEPDMTQELKIKLKKKYVTPTKIAESPERIKKIAFDIVEHYTKNVLDDGYKAMIVASSREAAVLYKRELDRLNAPLSKIIMDQKHGECGKDGYNWDEYYLTDQEKRQIEISFIDSKNAIKILIVVDMLLVGFDAPIVRVLYLDKSLKEHALLQAIARVNRPYDEWKREGLIVDYYGITKNIQKALEVFDTEDIRGAWESDDFESPELKLYHEKVMNHLKGHDIKNIDIIRIIKAFEYTNKRDTFHQDFKKFAKVLNLQMYKKESIQYVDDFKNLSKIRQLLKNTYDKPGEHTQKYASRIQKIINDAIRSKGVSELVKPIEITFENFLAFASKIEDSQARTILIKKKAEQVIEEKRPQNPAYYEKLWQILQRLIEEEEERRKNNADYFNPELEIKIKGVYEKALSDETERKKLGFENNFEFVIYELIKKYVDNRKKSVKISKILSEKLLQQKSIIEWYNKQRVMRNIKRIIYDELESYNIPDGDIQKLTEKIKQVMISDKTD